MQSTFVYKSRAKNETRDAIIGERRESASQCVVMQSGPGWKVLFASVAVLRNSATACLRAGKARTQRDEPLPGTLLTFNACKLM